MCDHGDSVILPTPDWFWNDRSSPESGISIDACIAEELADAWRMGVRTLGSCCGHGKTGLSVVLIQDEDQIELAKKILPGWTLYQWQLVDVTGREYEDGPTQRLLKVLSGEDS